MDNFLTTSHPFITAVYKLTPPLTESTYQFTLPVPHGYLVPYQYTKITSTMPLAKQCPQLVTIVLTLLIIFTLSLVFILESTRSASETDKLNGTTSASTSPSTSGSSAQEMFSCDIQGRCGGGVDMETGLREIAVAGGGI
jgi:hypothetical protein